jgi:hypothetical protein
MATISKEAEMEFTTTIGDLPKQVKRHQLAPTTKIRVIVEEMKKKGKARYIQIGDKSFFEDFEPVQPEPGARLASDIVYEQRKQ